jgi:hypothetical protein
MSAEPDVDPGRDPAAADGQPSAARQVGVLLAAARHAGWHNRGRILGVAFVVSFATVGADIIVDHFLDPHNNALSITGTLVVELISLFGTILLSGFLCRLVHHDQYEVAEPSRPAPGADQPVEDHRSDRAGAAQPVEERVTVGHVIRTLPWGRLAIADIVAAILIGVGLLLLVIPGLVVLTLLAVLGPVIELERRPVFAALRRSARLVRQHFWWVALLISVPVAAVGELESVLPDPHNLGDILEVLAARGLGGALVETVIGLIVVEVCFWLIDTDARRPPPGDD